jgi:glutamine synthetase
VRKKIKLRIIIINIIYKYKYNAIYIYIMQTGNVSIEYVWISGNYELRSKIKVMYDTRIDNISDIPEWNYDGSSTDQAEGINSEIIIKPMSLFKESINHMYVICDTYDYQGNPLETNNRFKANETFDKNIQAKPWFGLEQEYFLIDPKTNKPLGFDSNKNQGQYYCSVGCGNAHGRHIAEEHMKFCMKVGVNISGMNAEVAPGQWEYQIGPCEGIEAGDHLWMARYLLQKVAEKHNIIVNIEPKPLEGDWNGSGCHTNYSTEYMRNGSGTYNGLFYINKAIDNLSLKHEEHMNVYGIGNELRMTGNHETANYKIFSQGIANRGASIRIGNSNYNNKKGYFEDRRPSSNCDPYLVTSIIFKTTVLEDEERLYDKPMNQPKYNNVIASDAIKHIMEFGIM